MLPTRGARSRRRLSPATIRVVRRSWPAWVTCPGRSETPKGDRRVSCSHFKRGELAASQMPRRKPLLLVQETRERKMPKPKKMTVAQKYRSLKSQTEKAGMTVKEKAGKLVVYRNKGKKKNA